MKSLFLLPIIFLFGCATPDIHLAQPEVRQKTYTVETKLKKSEAFDKLQAWAAKAGGEIRLNDRASSIIVLRANVDCSALKLGNGWAKSEVLWFVLEMKVDKQVSLNFSDLKATSLNAWDSDRHPANQEESDVAFSECIDPIKNSISKTL